MRLALALALALVLALTGSLRAHGDLHERIEKLTAQITRSPESGSLYLQRAALLAAHEDWAAAAADYDQAESLQADITRIRLGRAKVLIAQKRPDDARRQLDPLLARDPRHVEARVTRGRSWALLGETQAAAEDFTAAITASPHPEPEYFLERAAILAAASPPRLDDAIRGLDEGLSRLGGDVVTLQLAVIDLEVKAGRLDAALARLDRAAATASRPESWLIRRGALLEKAGRTREASVAYQAALAAIAKLPPRARKTRTVVDMETQARRALQAAPAAR